MIVDDVTGALSEIKVKMIVTGAKYGSATSAAGLHSLVMERKGAYSADGLSGGAVFHLGEDARGFYCGFAGIVLRGSDTSDILHFMDSRLISRFFRFHKSHQLGTGG
jgi:hypothetical protein